MKKTTIYDIARAVGLSPVTVNRALTGNPAVKPDTRERVLRCAREMGYRQNRAASLLSRTPLHLCAVLYDAVSDFTEDLRQGAEAAFSRLKDFGLSGSVHLLERTLSAGDYRRAAQDIAANEKPDGLLLLPCSDNEEMKALIKDLSLQGVPVATVVSDIFDSGRIFTVGRNGLRCGAFAAELLSHMMRDKSRPAAVLTSTRDAFVHSQTIEGFSAFAASAGLSCLGAFEHFDDPEKARNLADELLLRYPDLGGLYFNSANSLSFCRRLREIAPEKEIAIVVSDFSEPIAQMIESRQVGFSIFSDPFLQGRKAVEKMYAYLTENELPPQGQVQIEPQIVMRSNLDYYRALPFSHENKENTKK